MVTWPLKTARFRTLQSWGRHILCPKILPLWPDFQTNSKPCSYVCGVALCIWSLVGMALEAPYICVLFLLRYSDCPWIDQLLLEWCLPWKVLFVYMLTSSCVFILFSSCSHPSCYLLSFVLLCFLFVSSSVPHDLLMGFPLFSLFPQGDGHLLFFFIFHFFVDFVFHHFSNVFVFLVFFHLFS